MAIRNLEKIPTLLRKDMPLMVGGALLTGVLLFLWQLGPNIHPDTASYLAFSPLRSALYPIILCLNTWIFGPEHFQWLVFCQLTYGFYAAILLAQKISRFFNLNIWAFFLLLLCLLCPYYESAKFGNAILTEAVCYPTFLLAFGYLWEGLIYKNTRRLLYFLSLTVLLILTRRQFLFLYPVFGMVLIYLALFEKKTIQVGLLALAFLVSILLTNILERTYQYIVHGHFSTIPFTGIELVRAPLYIAKDSDINLFETDLERSVFKETREALKQKKLCFDSTTEAPLSDLTIFYTHFYKHYVSYTEALLPALARNGITDPYQVDTITTKMSIKLIFHNLKPYLALYLINIILNMGGYYYCLLLGMVGLLALIQHYKHRDRLSLSCLLMLTLSFANYSMVALVEVVHRRYATYTNTIQTVLLLVCVMLAFHVWHEQHRRFKNDQ